MLGKPVKVSNTILAVFFAASFAFMFVAGCGGDSGTDPVLPPGDNGGDNGGGDGDDGEPVLPQCPTGEFLQFSPIPLEKLDHITALGNVAPPAHIFPTDHIYLYLQQDGVTGSPVTADVVSPGDMVVKSHSCCKHEPGPSA